ncbi:tail virion protein G7P-2 [Pseudomonas alloputida]
MTDTPELLDVAISLGFVICFALGLIGGLQR